MKRWAWLAWAPLPLLAGAQGGVPEGGGDLGARAVEQVATAGRTAFDLIRVSSDKFSFALRFGNVIPRSERVELDGRILVRDRDYAIEPESGVIYLKVPYRDGQSLRVSYRYDDTKSQEGVFGGATSGAGAGFAFELTPGARAFVGLGYTERLGDGTVLSGNLFGFNNTFSFAGGSVSGVMFLNERTEQDATSLLGDDGARGRHETGQGKAIVQGFTSRFGGGKVEIGFQDIDDRFAGFQAFSSAGFSAEQVNALRGERGLKRTRFALSEVGGGAFRMGGGYEFVGDGNGGVTWRRASFGLGALKLDWASTVVDSEFTKFGGLREKDRGQLAKERGLERETLGLASSLGTGKATFQSLSVRGFDGNGVWRSGFQIDHPWVKAEWTRQSVDEGFHRFGDLREEDRGQLAKERGMDRNAWSFSTAPGGLGLSLSSAKVGTRGGEMRALDGRVEGRGWSFSHVARGMGDGFSGLHGLTGADRERQMSGVVGMYEAGAKAHGNDNGAFGQTGIDRAGWRFEAGSKGWKGHFNQVKVGAGEHGYRLNDAALTFGKTQLRVKDLRSDDGFDAMRRLYWSEQQRVGTVNGLDKTDIDLSTEFGKSKLNLNWMDANAAQGAATRRAFRFEQPGLNLSYTRRNVEEGFRSIGEVVDPERDLLRSLVGYDQSELAGLWQVNPGLKLNFRQVEAANSLLDRSGAYREAGMEWALSRQTSLWLRQVEQSESEMGVSTRDMAYQGISLNQDLGRVGRVTLTREQHSFDGSQDRAPDATRQAVAFETKLTDRTSLRTEQSETRFEDGTRETSSSNTLKTALNSRVGVSVTDTQIRRDGDRPDEVRRNYGLWVDFGRGIRLDYGYNRDMRGEDTGVKQTSTTLSGGEFGGIKLDGASYRHNRWDGRRDQHFGNVSFANVTPFRFGIVEDFKFYYRTDTQRDYLSWQKELLNMGSSFGVGSFGFAWDYASQVGADGNRAIDRTFTLSTDRSNKAPLRAAVKYGVRTLPNDEEVMIRDYSLTYQASRNLLLQHNLLTNPVQQRGNALLGTVSLDERRSSWVAKYQNDPRFAFDFSWSEIKREQRGERLKREARLDMTLFADNASPVKLSYALQQYDRNNFRSLAHSYGISFTQRPGPNQALSFSLEHLQWGQGRPGDSRLRDWALRFDYNWRF